MESDQRDEDDIDSSWRFLSILPCTSELEKSDPQRANLLYERAIRENAGSYKLWHAYLLHRVSQLKDKPLNDELYEEVNNCFERALVFMHRMPRIWIEYCTLLDKQCLITKTRRTFDRSLEALPITQHSRIWVHYLDFIKKEHIPIETAVRIYKRYLQLHPENAEDYIDYLHAKNRIDEAVTLFCDIINRPNFQSKRNKSKYQLWEELCDMICDYADQIHTIDAESVLRDGISKYNDQQGRLWNSLAQFHVHLGMFSSARNVFDEAINHVTTKKDFVEVWEAYTNFEEKYLEHLIEQENLTQDQVLEIEMRQTSLEELITNNGLLLNRVALRQNPHNVREWQKRVQLCNEIEDPEDTIEDTYMKAIHTIDPKQALGSYEDLWIDYATFHASLGRVERAREIFEKAVEVQFVRTDDLAKVWCSYIEYELSLKANESNLKALKLAKRAVSTVKNLKIWLFYADLEEILGNFSSTKAAYDRILDLKIATPQVILNYASFLEEKQYYEDSFRVYERGVSLFRWPASYNIWHTYLNKFLSRYGSKKLDRARDILEQCLKNCPSKYAFEIFLLYAKLEEENGLLSRAQSIYTRAAEKIESKNKSDLFRIYIRSMMNLVDITKIRAIYEQAIEALDNKNARKFCLEYANLEEELGETDRARTIYSFCSQMCDPRVDKEFWKLWADFEQKFGCLETIDDMLRIKRSIEALFPKPEYLSDITIETATISKALEESTKANSREDT